MLPMATDDAYRVLDICEGATPDEIKNAYRIMALKWHPDRHHNIYDKDLARSRFMEVTDAYRTLVREGHLKHCSLPFDYVRPENLAPRRRPPMAHRSSSESSVSLDSFIHLVASSTESHTTAPPSHGESPRSSWKQGIRQPTEPLASQYRNVSARPYTYSYEPPLRKGDGPAIYKAPSPYSPGFIPPAPATHSNATGPTRFQKHYVPHSGDVHPPMNTSSSFRGQPPSLHPHQTSPTFSQGPRSQTPPYAIPLVSNGLGSAGEWVYSLSLTLEELFSGKHCRFGITRSYLSNKSKNVVIEIDIPAGCRPGTRILCRNVGHEWRPGAFQDIAFIIEEAAHDRFVRLFDDLIMDVRLPWVDSLRKQGGKVPFMGIDGRSLVIQIDYSRDKSMKGRSIVKGAGMPVRERGQVVGRGNLIVQWEILPRKTKIMHFLRRLWGGN